MGGLPLVLSTRQVPSSHGGYLRSPSRDSMPADGGASSPVDVTRAARRLGIVVVAAAERRVNRVQPTIAAHSTARRFKHEIAFMIVIFIWLQNHSTSRYTRQVWAETADAHEAATAVSA